MEEICTKKIGEIEYLKLGNIHIDETAYALYMDTETNTKVRIFKNEKEVTNKAVIRQILNKFFLPKQKYILKEKPFELHAEDSKRYHLEDDKYYIVLSEDAKKALLERCMQIFQRKFGTKLLTKEKLQHKIDNGIKEIMLSKGIKLMKVVETHIAVTSTPNIEFSAEDKDKIDSEQKEEEEPKEPSPEEMDEDEILEFIESLTNPEEEDEKDEEDVAICGLYYPDEQWLMVLLDEDGRLDERTTFHEFIHGITASDLTKKLIEICSDVDEEYEYGVGLREGMVSYIENMKNAKHVYLMDCTNSYDEERCLTAMLKILYDNIKGEKDYNLIESFILEPKGTLPKVNKIFAQDIRANNPNAKERTIQLASMKRSLKFILSMDYLCSRDESEKEQSARFENLEKVLESVYYRQIKRMPIETKQKLFDMLYQVKTFEYFDMVDDLNECKMEIIQKAMRNIPGLTFQSIYDELPKRTKDTPKGEKEDFRYEDIQDDLEIFLKIEKGEKKRAEKEMGE